MTSLPLHPAIVHLPLGLAFLMPLLALGFAWALSSGHVRPRAWLVIVLLQTLLLGAGLVAMTTGEREEERVESVVPEAALERHEAYAEQFVWATGATLLVALLVLPFRTSPAARMLIGATVFGTAVVCLAAVRVGHAGGQLVYVYNAGAAYAASQAEAAPAAASGAAKIPRPANREHR